MLESFFMDTDGYFNKACKLIKHLLFFSLKSNWNVNSNGIGQIQNLTNWM